MEALCDKDEAATVPMRRETVDDAIHAIRQTHAFSQALFQPAEWEAAVEQAAAAHTSILERRPRRNATSGSVPEAAYWAAYGRLEACVRRNQRTSASRLMTTHAEEGVSSPSSNALTAYELQRRQNIRMNEEMLRSVGLL